MTMRYSLRSLPGAVFIRRPVSEPPGVWRDSSVRGAIRRCGELLQDFKSAGARTDLNEVEPSKHDLTRLPATQRSAADQAGMSERQRVTAVERLAEKGVITLPPMVEKPTNGRPGLVYVLSGRVANVENGRRRIAAQGGQGAGLAPFVPVWHAARMGWASLLIYTAAALALSVPWWRVATAPDRQAMTALRQAAMITVFAIWLIWAAWLFGAVRETGAEIGPDDDTSIGLF